MKASQMTIQPRRHSGFTLMELIVAMTITAILASVAYPLYTNYVLKARRTEGKSALMRVQGALERYYTVYNGYTTDPAALQLPTCTGSPTSTFSADSCSTSAYTITISPGTGGIATSYAITATPVKADATCGNLKLDQTNVKSYSGTGTTNDCW